MIWRRKESIKNVAPLQNYFYVSFSNFSATFCQYEGKHSFFIFHFFLFFFLNVFVAFVCFFLLFLFSLKVCYLPNTNFGKMRKDGSSACYWFSFLSQTLHVERLCCCTLCDVWVHHLLNYWGEQLICSTKL